MMRYLKSYNESIKDFLKPKSDDKIDEELIKLSPSEILKKSVEYNHINGFKYLLDNNLVDETAKYLIEKYQFGMHQDEMKDYEEWFLEQLKELDVSRSKKYKVVILYKKNHKKLMLEHHQEITTCTYIKDLQVQ